jgi:hypothetical protein
MERKVRILNDDDVLVFVYFYILSILLKVKIL